MGAQHPSRWIILVITIIFVHTFFMISIFDIYFRTPLIHGMKPVEQSLPPQSKRLLLFVGDGCRADMFFEQDMSLPKANSTLAPFLRNIFEEHGVFGVSHTRVPTESRPGHVALLAGIYEDVSAVTTGWKENPVEFDHIFRHTSHSWGYGSPDIMPMFASTAPQMNYECYEKDAEDFSIEASALDTWTFEKVKNLFAEAKTNSTLDSMLREDQVFIFLHLLGLDTNGHGFRPRSPEYANNIRLVDRGVQEIVETVNAFYGDDATSFLFTADHGMSDRGNHGDGDSMCTRTPLVAWGPAIRGPILVDEPSSKQPKFKDPPTPPEWNLGKLKRVDVDQADLAPLMSFMAGVPFPVNSVGVLPLDFVRGGAREKAHVGVSNAVQHLRNLAMKQAVKEKECRLLFSPFPQLSSVSEVSDELRALLVSSQFDKAVERSQEVIHLVLDGLRYYQTYDWLFLRGLITLGYVGCVLYVIGFVLSDSISSLSRGGLSSLSSSSSRSPASSKSIPLFGGILLLTSIWLLLQSAPTLYFVYLFLTCAMWERVLSQLGIWIAVLRHVKSNRKIFIGTIRSILICVSLGVIMVIMFYCRWFTVVPLVLFAWWGYRHPKLPSALRSSWSGLCILTSLFTILPIDMGNGMISILAVNGSAFSLFAMALWPLLQRSVPIQLAFKALLAVNVMVIAHSWILLNVSSFFIRQKAGLPMLCSILAYSHIGVAAVVIWFLPRNYMIRIVSVSAVLSPLLLLLSVGYESLFFCAFTMLCVVWVEVERTIVENAKIPGAQCVIPAELNASLSSSSSSSSSSTTTPKSSSSSSSSGSESELTFGHVRIGAFFFVFVFLSLFGAGNVASVTSFELSSVYRFTTVFDPFWMMLLILIKIFIPFIPIGVCFFIITRDVLRVKPWSVAIFSLVISEVSSIVFFYRVSDEGSWLDIGQSIAHFAIMNFMVIILFTIIGGCSVLVRNVRLDQSLVMWQTAGKGRHYS